jgi:hypothetical protein
LQRACSTTLTSSMTLWWSFSLMMSVC